MPIKPTVLTQAASQPPTRACGRLTTIIYKRDVAPDCAPRNNDADFAVVTGKLRDGFDEVNLVSVAVRQYELVKGVEGGRVRGVARRGQQR